VIASHTFLKKLPILSNSPLDSALSMKSPNFDWTTSNYEKKVKEPHEFLKIHLIKSINDEDIKVN
jgi:hypothetical protein